MALIGDMVVQTANAPGTGVFNLIPAPAARSSFVSQCGAGQVYYIASDAASWEKGVGTVTAGSPDTLSRDTVLGNSLGTTARVSFSSVVTIISDIPAERSLWADVGGAAWLVSNRRLAGLASATDVADAPRLDQVGMRQIGSRITIGSSSGYPAGTVNVIFSVPSGLGRFRVEWENAVPSSANGQMICRMSADGSNFYQGSSDYMQQSFTMVGATTTPTQNDYSFIGITPGLVTTAPSMGRIEVAARSDHSYELFARGLLPSGWWSQQSNGKVAPNPNAEMAAILLGMTGGFGGGTFRLLGAL